MAEKKEIGKLLELLNEYSKNIGYFNEEDLQGQTKAWILSKEFGWVKWLVENDKIDKKKIDTRLVRNVESHYDEDGYWVENSYEDYSIEETLLMLLSISDSPIDDLLLYLK